MPSETQYAVSVSATVTDDTGASVAIHSPTFYLHPDVQGITNEDHAKRIVSQWFGRLGLEYTVAVAATTVDTPDPQGEPRAVEPDEWADAWSTTLNLETGEYVVRDPNGVAVYAASYEGDAREWLEAELAMSCRNCGEPAGVCVCVAVSP